MMNHTNFTNFTNTKEFPDIPLSSFTGISIAVFAVIGILANCLVLTVLSISQRKRFSAYKYLISHLAFSDLLCSIMYLLYVPVELAGHNWVYNEPICKTLYPSITFLTNLSVGTILVISSERYIGARFPQCGMTNWKRRNVALCLSIVWIGGIILGLPNFATLTITRYDNLAYCNENWEGKGALRKIYGISFFILAFLMPLLALVFMHISIMVILRRQLRPTNFSPSQEKVNVRIMRVLTAMVIAFFICVSPNKILYFVWDMAPSLEKSPNSNARFYLRTIQILFYARTAVDPLLYCFFDTRFKIDLARTVKSVRGLSYADSELTKSRARTLSQRVPPDGIRSRASSQLSADGPPLDTYFKPTELISKLSIVPEIGRDTALSIDSDIIKLENRSCSGSYDTTDQITCDSNFPLVKSNML